MPVGVVTWQPTGSQPRDEARLELARLIKSNLRQVIVTAFNTAHATDPDSTKLSGIGEAIARLRQGDLEDENVGDMEVLVTVSPGEGDGHIARENEIRANLVRGIDGVLAKYPRLCDDAAITGGIDVDLHFERMAGCNVDLATRRVTASWGGGPIDGRSIDDL